jgi:hypothetical protein
MPNETCILCGKETTVDINTHIDFRTGYIEGAGQLCTTCYTKGTPKGREMITIPRHFVEMYPNDFELGEAIRRYYWSEYKKDEIKPVNQYVCQYCGGDTSEVEYDYLSGTDHLSCALKTNE